MQEADKTFVDFAFFLWFFFFFVMKREKTIWFDTLGKFSPLSSLAKENYSLHALRGKSIIPNKSQSCCPFFFSAVRSGTLGNVDFMSYSFAASSRCGRQGES